MDKSFCTNVKKEYNKNNVFVCTFCKKEFASMGSVFSHMSDEHEFVNKSI